MCAWLLCRAACIGVAALTLTLLATLYWLSILHVLSVVLEQSNAARRHGDGGEADVGTAAAQLLGQLSSPAALQYLTLSNVVMQALFVVLFVLLVCLDDALVALRERLRARAQLPSQDVIDHYNQRSYDMALQKLSSVRLTRRHRLAMGRAA